VTRTAIGVIDRGRIPRALAVYSALAVCSAHAGCLSDPAQPLDPAQPAQKAEVPEVAANAQALFLTSCDTNLLQQIVPTGSSPSSIALSADDNMTIDERATVTRPNGTYAPILSAGSLLHTDIEGQVGDVKSRAPVLLTYPGKVNGSVISAGAVTVLPGASVTGTIQRNTTVPLSTIQRTITFPTNPGSSVLVPIGGSRTITPGAYRDIVVPLGGTLTIGRAGPGYPSRT